MPWKARVKALGLQAIAMRTVAEWEPIDLAEGSDANLGGGAGGSGVATAWWDLARSGRNLYFD